MQAVEETKKADDSRARADAAEPAPASGTATKGAPPRVKKPPKPARPEAPAPRALAIMGLCAVAMLVLSEIVARAVTAPPSGRLPNVQRLPDDPLAAPAPPEGPQVLVMGSSQLYMEPGTKPGDLLRTDASLTTIDYLARASGERASFYVYGYPRLLPFEMIVATKHLFDRGYAPNVAIVSITWPTVAHDRDLKPPFRDVMRERGFALALRTELAASGARPETLAVAGAEAARAATDEAHDDQASHANGVDRTLLRFARDHSVLFGRSGELRDRIGKSLIDPVVVGLARAPPVVSDPVDDANLATNVAATYDLVAMLRRHGVRVFMYRAPERAGIAPITATDQRDEALGRLAEDLAALGVAVVDARDVVPAEYWGWTSQYPDRSHFVSKGHEILADFVVREARSRMVFDALGEEAK